MNNAMRKEFKTMIENEIFFYNQNVKKYNLYKNTNSVRCQVAETLCDKYRHSCNRLIKMLNCCDSFYDYSLEYQSLEFYSPCYLVVKKV